MFIVFGFRVRLRTVDEGVFHCPRCGVDRAFHRRVARRWFTIFFIPLVPLRVLAEVIECRTCNGRFDSSVLRLPTTASISAELDAAMRAAVAAVVEASHPAGAAVRSAAVTAMADVGTRPYLDATLTWDLERHASVGYEDRLRRIAASLEPVGREHLLSTLAGIAAAGGAYTDAEQRILERAGAALGLSPAHVRGVLDLARMPRQ